ncbi:MAG TPA: PIN domain-containing protein [Flavobacteriaceae bacterium]|nr:PIN domain-containing protein [Flavobacteriaceae bacterium]
MDKLIVDSNIIFSAILNVNSRIAQILLTGENFYEFFAPKYLRSEIWEHHEKIKNIARLSVGEFQEVYELVLKNVTILNHSIVPKEDYQRAFELCEDIDPADTAFVAFSLYLNCKIWTGDKKLIKGLSKKGFKKIATTENLFKEFLRKKQ